MKRPGILLVASLLVIGCARNAEEKQLEAMRDEIDNLREARDRADREAGLSADKDPSLVVPAAYRANAAPPPRPVPTVVQLGARGDGPEPTDVGDPQDTTPRPSIRVQGQMRGAGRNAWRVEEVEQTGADEPGAGGGGGAGGSASGGAGAGASGGANGSAGAGAGAASFGQREGSAIDPEAKRAYDGAIGLVNAKKYDQALDAFARFLVTWPDHPYANNAMYWRGECYFARGDFKQAADQFEGVLARFPSGSKVPDALLKLGLTYQKLGNPAKAKEAFDRLASQFPDTEAARHIPGARPPGATGP